MAPRQNLQDLLKTLLGSSNVYFQPPADLKMEFPCIVYQRDDGSSQYADNSVYRFKLRYQLSYISEDPDSPMVGKLAALPLCSYSRFYVADNLNHDVFTIFY